MPNYITSNLAKAQALLLAGFASNEKRFRTPVVFQEFLKGAPIMFPNSKILRTREDRPIEAYYNARTARALGTGRTHNHTGVKGDSGLLTPGYISYTDKFNISLKQGDNNVLSLGDQLNNEIDNVVINMAEGLEAASADYLFNNRSTVNNAVADGTFNAVNDVFEIAIASENRAVQIGKTMMHENKYSTNLIYFCDTIAFNKFEFYAAQGSGNSQNLTFQYSNVQFVHSVELNAKAITLGYTNGFVEAVPAGSIAALDWIPKQNINGIGTSVNEYSTLLNPVDGLNYAVHTYETRADDTANNGMTQDVVTQAEVSLDVALEHAPLTTAGETTIQAFALV